jgi:hypothetical protein
MPPPHPTTSPPLALLLVEALQRPRRAVRCLLRLRRRRLRLLRLLLPNALADDGVALVDDVLLLLAVLARGLVLALGARLVLVLLVLSLKDVAVGLLRLTGALALRQSAAG